MSAYVEGYGTIGILLLVGVATLMLAFVANWVLRPPSPATAVGSRNARERVTFGLGTYETYECGVAVDSADLAWAQTHIRYYVYAFIYVVFAVETVFVYPWATIFTKPGFGTGALVEMGVFIAFLAVGLLYAWRKRVLMWD